MATLDLTVLDMTGDLEIDLCVPLEGGVGRPAGGAAGGFAQVAGRTIGEAGLMQAAKVVLAPARNRG